MKKFPAILAAIIFAFGMNACGGSNDVSGINTGTTPTPTTIPATPTPTPVPSATVAPTPIPTKTPTPVPTPTSVPSGLDSVSLVSNYPLDGATLYMTQYVYFKINYVNAGNHPNATLAVFFSNDGTTRLPTGQLYNVVGNGAGASSASSTLLYSSATSTSSVILVFYDRIADPSALRPFATSSVNIRYIWSPLLG